MDRHGDSLADQLCLDACFCGPNLPYTLLGDNFCASPCNGASGELCGSSSTLSVYNATLLAATVPKPSSSVTSSTVSRTVSASGSASVSATGNVSQTGSTTVSPSVTGSATRTTSSASTTTSGAAGPFATYISQGCIADGSTRSMNDTSTYAGDMTVVKCANIAKSGGFKYFGMENGGQCFVSNKLAYNTPAAGCTMPCMGDPTKQTMCGGSWKISLYQWMALSEVPATTTGPSTSATPTSTTTLAGGSSTCAAVTVTQTASATVTVTVTGGAATTSTNKVVKKRRGAAGERSGNFKKYSFIKHIR